MSSLSALKQLAGDSLIYGISGTISRSLLVLLVPVYTRLFEPSEYAVLGLTTTFFSLVTILVLMGMDNSVARWYYDTEDAEDQRISLNTFLWSCLSTAILLSVLIFTVSDRLAGAVFNAPGSAFVLRIAAVNLPFTVFTAFTWNLLRMQRRPIATGTFTLATSLLTIGLNVLFIVGLGWGISGIFYAQVLTSLFATMWTVVLFRHLISMPRIDFRRWLDMLKFSLPLIPGSVAFWIVNLSGTYFIQWMIGPHEAGLYQVGATVATGMTLLTGAFQMAWGPFAFSIHKAPNAKIVYSHALLGYTALSCAAGLVLALFSREILLVFTTPEYAESFWIVGILGFNFVLIGMSYIAAIGPGIAKTNLAFGVSMVISATLLVGLNFVLVPVFGKEGAALSTLLAQMIVPVAVFWHGQRLYPIPYNFGRTAIIFASSVITAFGGLSLLQWASLPLTSTLLIKLALALAYGALMLTIFRAELAHLWTFFLVNRKAS